MLVTEPAYVPMLVRQKDGDFFNVLSSCEWPGVLST